MPTPDEYRFCVRLGMTQAECAAHLGVSRAAVTKAKRKHNLTFGNGMALSQGRQWEMEMYAHPGERQAYVRYPWEKLAVGDWCAVQGSASVNANRANVRLFPRKFRAVMRGGVNVVLRAA